jgi:hypothetical protein
LGISAQWADPFPYRVLFHRPDVSAQGKTVDMLAVDAARRGVDQTVGNLADKISFDLRNLQIILTRESLFDKLFTKVVRNFSFLHNNVSQLFDAELLDQ